MSLLSNNLQTFLSIVKSGTVHGAASELRLTQTGVTQRLRSLEGELKTTLFLRSRRGMRLTQEGEVLLRYCNSVVDLEGETFGLLSGAVVNRNIFINVVGPTSVMTSRIVTQCAKLYGLWPQLNLNFQLNDTDDRISLIRSGQAAFAIVSPDLVPNETDSKVLKPDKYILVAAKEWKGRRLSELISSERLIDFYESDQTSLKYLKKFGLLKHLRRPRLFANNNEVVTKLFCEGIGFGTLTQEVAKPFLESGQLITLNGNHFMEDSLALVWYPRPEMPDYFSAIIKSIN